MAKPSRPSRLRVSRERSQTVKAVRKPRIEPPGTMPRVGDRIVKVRRCCLPRYYSAPIGTRATVVKVVTKPFDHDEGAWTDMQLKKGKDTVTVCPSLYEFEERGGWRVCKRKGSQ